MIFYRCTTCNLITSEIFNRCPSCGVESKKIKEKYIEVHETGLFGNNEKESLSGLFKNGYTKLEGDE